jgi:hypothetical protein
LFCSDVPPFKYCILEGAIQSYGGSDSVLALGDPDSVPEKVQLAILDPPHGVHKTPYDQGPWSKEEIFDAVKVRKMRMYNL